MSAFRRPEVKLLQFETKILSMREQLLRSKRVGFSIVGVNAYELILSKKEAVWLLSDALIIQRLKSPEIITLFDCVSRCENFSSQKFRNNSLLALGGL